jgi:short-subunit dehydrogenase
MKKVILVTGASSGIGRACATALQAAGHIVYGASRTIAQLKDISFIPLEMDITDDNSVNSAVEQIIKEQGRIDVLINNAGAHFAGPLYTTSVEFAKKQFEVNFFGLMRVSTAVLPGMIYQKHGLLINISSVVGFFGIPYMGAYAAAKFALEGYSQSLRMELQNTGVKVTLVNPADFKTNTVDSREKLPFTLKHEKLEAEYTAAIEVIEKNELNGGNPAVVGKLITKIVAAQKPAHRYLVGDFGQTRLPLIAKALLPGSLFSRVINSYYHIK